MYSNCDFLLLPWQQRRSRVSPHWVATNSFAACFWVCSDTVGFYHCVFGKSFLWSFLLGSCPFRCLLRCPFGRWDANLAGGSASCLFVGVFCVLVFMICQYACDHLCPCCSFLDYSLFSCKDRALERDWPYQRKKDVWRWCLWPDSNNAPQESIWMGRRTSPEDSECWGPSFGPLRKANIFQKGPKSDPLRIESGPSWRACFWSFHFVRCAEALQAAMCAKCQLEATLTQTASVAGILNCTGEAHFCAPAFSCVLKSKKGLLAYCFASIIIGLRPSRCLEACLEIAANQKIKDETKLEAALTCFFFSRPRGAVGIAALLCRWQTGGGSIPRWSASKTQDRRPAERQRARNFVHDEICCNEGAKVVFSVSLHDDGL